MATARETYLAQALERCAMLLEQMCAPDLARSPEELAIFQENAARWLECRKLSSADREATCFPGEQQWLVQRVGDERGPISYRGERAETVAIEFVEDFVEDGGVDVMLVDVRGQTTGEHYHLQASRLGLGPTPWAIDTMEPLPCPPS